MYIRVERKEDERKVEELIRECFYNVYMPGCQEHYLMHILRDSNLFVKELNLVMVDDQKEIIGQAVCIVNRYQSFDEEVEILSLGPICIAPHYQKLGLGKQLVEYCCKRAKELGYQAIMLEGNPSFYEKCGFQSGSTYQIHYEDLDDKQASFFLVRELEKGYLKPGKYFVHPIYYLDKKQVEKFDATFPSKEKKKQEGQLFD